MIWDYEVKEIILSTNSRQIGVLPNHAPIATAVDIGLLRIRRNGQWLTVALMGGFAIISNNEITILGNDAEISTEESFVSDGNALGRKDSNLRELIETLARAHERTPLANLIQWKDKPVALSIVQARLVGLAHFSAGPPLLTIVHPVTIVLCGSQRRRSHVWRRCLLKSRETSSSASTFAIFRANLSFLIGRRKSRRPFPVFPPLDREKKQIGRRLETIRTKERSCLCLLFGKGGEIKIVIICGS
ncbi:hypothetical protein KSP40_PGU018417 [Platanthera guangdongensis]|uniref:ATP synthase F1 complex delta/epsilon subunit N-terminal domain-containing protein n=1 Tax=Platanthera guangdongensis TaxID=2320717 RepID=A0ABR2LUK2_9ASPA